MDELSEALRPYELDPSLLPPPLPPKAPSRLWKTVAAGAGALALAASGWVWLLDDAAKAPAAPAFVSEPTITVLPAVRIEDPAPALTAADQEPPAQGVIKHAAAEKKPTAKKKKKPPRAK
jgi:hypothetical protein